MQLLGPRTSTLGTVYQAADIQAQLTAGEAREQYVFDRLDSAQNYLSDLTPFVEKRATPPTITHDTTQAVKRTLTIRFKGDVPLYAGGILSLNNQVRAHYQLLMPDGGFVDFVLGTFVVLPAGGEVRPGVAWHDLTASDYGQVLLDYNFQTSTSVAGGVSAVSAVASLLSIPGSTVPLRMLIPDLGRTLALPLTWDPGMSRLKAINDILGAVAYFPAWFDEFGRLRSSPIPDWNTVKPSFTFDGTQQGSILQVPFRQTVDWSLAGNIQTVYVEDPRRAFFSATYINVNPLSPVSVQNLGHPKSLAPIKDSTIPDAASALLVAKASCQAAARLYQSWAMDTTAWPLGQDQDVLGATWSDADDGLVRSQFVESGWVMRCHAGGATTHTLNQLVAA